jgi:hypothetical protein
LKLLVTQVSEVRGVNCENRHFLRKMTKREVLDWMAEQWDVLGDTFTMITVNQRGPPVRSPSEFLFARTTLTVAADESCMSVRRPVSWESIDAFAEVGSQSRTIEMRIRSRMIPVLGYSQ